MSDQNQVLLQNAKAAAGNAAAKLVEEGMIVGLGTGTTAAYFIRALGLRCQEGLNISAVATSQESSRLAKQEKIPLIDIDDLDSLDLAVDGADEIDPNKRMIKGGGGALFKEKIIAAMSREMIVIIDESKQVDHLGKFPLPIEISCFGYRATLAKLNALGYRGTIRSERNGSLFVTENGNYIFDIQLEYPCRNPETINAEIQTTPGVIETGFFFEMAGRVVVGFPDDRVEIFP